MCVLCTQKKLVLQNILFMPFLSQTPTRYLVYFESYASKLILNILFPFHNFIDESIQSHIYTLNKGNLKRQLFSQN